MWEAVLDAGAHDGCPGMRAPCYEDDRAGLTGDGAKDGVGHRLPADPVVATCLPLRDGQDRVQQEHAAPGPRDQRRSVGVDRILSFRLVQDPEQGRRRWLHPVGHREGEAFCLFFRRIRVLADDHGPHRGKRRVAQRPKPLLTSREDVRLLPTKPHREIVEHGSASVPSIAALQPAGISARS
jgi:hypothetical protein